jgi:TPP-dependent indolepyruvate ferredoxin oxidoreductase alpha subunit
MRVISGEAQKARLVTKRVRYKCPGCNVEQIYAVECGHKDKINASRSTYCAGCFDITMLTPVYRNVLTARGWRKLGVSGDIEFFKIKGSSDRA